MKRKLIGVMQNLVARASTDLDSNNSSVVSAQMIEADNVRRFCHKIQEGRKCSS